MTSEVDRLDRRILRELRADVRSSYKSIGDRLGVSHNTIKARVDRMLEKGVFRFAVIAYPPKVGKEATAYLLVKVEPVALAEVAQAVGARREVAYAGFSMGEADFLVLAHFDTVKHLFNFVNGFVGTLPGVTSVRVVLMCDDVARNQAPHVFEVGDGETEPDSLLGEAVR